MRKLLLILMCIVLASTSLNAQFSGGGTGTSSDPFKLKTPQDVNKLRDYLGNLGAGKHFRIIEDIDMESYITSAFGSTGWNPIGNYISFEDESSSFQGYLHGGSYRIKGLHVNRTTKDYVGLFGALGSQSKIDSLGIITSTTKTFKARHYVGIFAGNNKGTISYCYAKGSVEGTENIGGIVGENDGIVEHSYNQAKVTGTKYCGGITGTNWNEIRYCYSAAQIICNIEAGALVGQNLQSRVLNCYWDSSLKSNGYGSNMRGTFTATGKSTADMKKASTFVYAGWNFSTYWKIKDTYTYPLLKWEITTPSGYKGDGTERSPFEIYTPADFNNLRNHLDQMYTGKYFKIMNDINLSSYSTGTYGWNPIGTETQKFNGILQGKGHKIIGLAMTRSNNYVGLFGYVGTTGHISELILETGVNKKMEGGNYAIGAFAGHNEGIIEFCANKGEVKGGNATGGLVGHNKGTVRYCYNTGKITDGAYIGGIIGDNRGTVTQTYNVGQIILSSTSGGFAGAIIGTNQSALVTSCYFDKQVSVVERGFGQQPLRSAAPTGLTTAQAKQKSSYVGWDFTNKWKMVGSIYPIFRFEVAPAEVYFAGGNGTSGNPYKISTPLQLDNVRLFANDNLYFEVINEIDLTTFIQSEYGSEGWLPIGDASSPFNGNINGKHFVIKGLNINRPDSDNIGLFGVISGAKINNMTVIGHNNNSISGRNNVGILIGKGSYSEVEMCCVMVGTNQFVYGTQNVGGMIGNSTGVNFTMSSSRVELVANSNAGGFMGFLDDLTRLDFCYSQGSVTCNTAAGGLIGMVQGRAMYLYYSYAACVMSGRGGNSVGGVVGSHPGAAKMQYAAFDSEINNYTLVAGRGLASEMPTSYMKQSSIMHGYGWNFSTTFNSMSALCANTNYDGVWTIVENTTYPLFPYEKRYCSYITTFQNRFNSSIATRSSLSNTKSNLTEKAETKQYNLLEENTIKVYPNPTKDRIQVEGEVNTEINVFDVNGKMILKTNNADVDLSMYPNGIYLIKVNGQTFKIVKE